MATRKKPAQKAKKARPVVKAATKAKPRKKVRTGSPPVGSIGEDAIERLITQWINRPKQAADYARLPRARLLDEATNMLAHRGDQKFFTEACTPIKESAFDYVEVIQGMLLREPHGGDAAKVSAPPSTPAARNALRDVRHTLGQVLARAEACGRPLRLFELGRAPWSASGFITQLFHVVQACRRRVEKWDDPIHAMHMFAELERRTLALERAWKLQPTGVPDDDEALRTMALQRLLFDAITYLAAYGRAVFAPEDKRHNVYLLAELFPKRASRGLSTPMKLLGE
jgi:hypothetical protein